MTIRALVFGLATASLFGAMVVASPASGSVPVTADTGPDLVSESVEPALSPALRDLPPITQPTGVEVPEGLIGAGTLHAPDRPASNNPTGPRQSEIVGDGPADLVPVNSFAGGTSDDYAGQQSPFFPPDTVGDVGPNHYVQMVNVSYQIWDKTGTSLAGPTSIKTLWSGLPDGTPCKDTDDGDPIVLYDQGADRWMLAQFSIFGTGLQMCIAYSTTPDPTGTYNAYAFDMPKVPDYEKFGVWPDGLYMSAYEGATLGAYVFDRAAMLAGGPAGFQRFEISAGGGPRGQRILPADWDGATEPPTGAPNPFLMSVDSAVQGGAADRLELYNFHVDWTTPGNSTFNLDQTLNTDPFSIDIGSNCMSGGTFRQCVPQPGTAVRVDDLSNRLMWRLQYRNFGDHQAMVTNQTVNSGSDTAALRWYELRSTGTSWSIHQQNTFAPADTNYRWMGSAAMDGQGNIALGYSISNATDVFPSINYTGQRVGAPLNTLSEAETRMFTGIASQTSSFHRWGDYSAMSVDPVDECTFWYTQMHIGAQEERLTRIGTAHFLSCAQSTAAELRLVKKTDPSAVNANLWTLKAEAAAPLEGKNFSNPGGSGVANSVFVDTPYTLSETGGPEGYTASAWRCTKAGEDTPYPGQNGSTVTVGGEDSVVCEITNTHDTAQLKLKKTVTGDGQKSPADWNLTAAADAPFAQKNFTVAGSNDSFSSVYSDTAYTLSESGPGGYTGTWVCTGTGVTQVGDTVKVAKDGQGTCTITNTRDVTSLTIAKELDVKDSGFTGTFDIDYRCVEGTTVKQGSVKLAAGASDTITGMPTGSVCTVTEPALPQAPSGWAFSAPRFEPTSGEVTLSKNQTARVTVTNALTRTSPAKQPCPVKVTVQTPKPTTVGNRVLTRKITTRTSACGLLKPVVLCRPLAPTSAGEKAFCDVTMPRRGKITINARGSEPLRVTVIVRAKPTSGSADAWKASTWRESWRLK